PRERLAGGRAAALARRRVRAAARLSPPQRVLGRRRPDRRWDRRLPRRRLVRALRTARRGATAPRARAASRVSAARGGAAPLPSRRLADAGGARRLDLRLDRLDRRRGRADARAARAADPGERRGRARAGPAAE